MCCYPHQPVERRGPFAKGLQALIILDRSFWRRLVTTISLRRWRSSPKVNSRHRSRAICQRPTSSNRLDSQGSARHSPVLASVALWALATSRRTLCARLAPTGCLISTPAGIQRTRTIPHKWLMSAVLWFGSVNRLTSPSPLKLQQLGSRRLTWVCWPK